VTSFLKNGQLPFTGVATRDDTAIVVSVSVGLAPTSQPGVFSARTERGFSFSIEARPGTHPITMLFHGRSMDSGLGCRGQ
jgi:hypothetical protein